MLSSLSCEPGGLTKTKKTRETNLELLRIVSMFLIIVHHCIIHGGGYAHTEGSNRIISYALIPGGKLGFTAFLALSTWFLVDQTFRATRFLKVYLEVLFYSVLFTGVSAIFGATLKINQWISVFLPINGNIHGFASTYLVFYLLIPFLNKAARHINRKQTLFLVCLLAYVQVGSYLIGQFAKYYPPFRSEITLFVLFYFISLYLKRYLPLKEENRKKTLAVSSIIFLFCWAFVFVTWILSDYESTNGIHRFLSSFCGDESSVIFIVGGYAMFFFFKSLKMPHVRWVNYLAKTMFGILLIHDHNFFRYVLWPQIIHAASWYNSPWFLLIVLVVSLAVFLACAAIDLFRGGVLEKYVFKIPFLQKFCKKLDGIFEDPKPDSPSRTEEAAAVSGEPAAPTAETGGQKEKSEELRR